MSKTKMTISFEGMQYVRDKYVDSKLTDTLFAAQMSKDLGHPYTVAKVRAYRYSLKIPNNVETKQTLAQELAEAKELLRRAADLLITDFDDWAPGHEDSVRELRAAVLEFLNPTAAAGEE